MSKYVYSKTTFKIPTFHWTIEVVLTTDVLSYADRIGYETNDDKTRALHLYYPEQMKSILILKPNANAATVAHESWHVVYHMLTDVGAGFDNEVVAYHLGYIVEMVTDLQAKWRKR